MAFTIQMRKQKPKTTAMPKITEEGGQAARVSWGSKDLATKAGPP